jgi:hypothetical protein
LDEIHGYVTPNLTWDWKRLDEAGWMKVFGLVLLAHQTALHELPHMLADMGAVERSPKPVESSHSLRDPLYGLVPALVATGMTQLEEEHDH